MDWYAYTLRWDTHGLLPYTVTSFIMYAISIYYAVRCKCAVYDLFHRQEGRSIYYKLLGRIGESVYKIIIDI